MANPKAFQTSGTLSKKRKWESGLYLDSQKAEKALETCQFCMKMCRFACPVAEHSKSEYLTPWGKMSAIVQPAENDPTSVLSTMACNHCNLCTAHCKHEIPVEAILTAKRKSVPGGMLSMAQVEARIALKAAYEGRPNVPPPRQISGSVMFWPAQGVDKVKAVLNGTYGQNQTNPFVNQILDIIHHSYSPDDTYLAPAIDTGFDLYSAGLEQEFIDYCNSIRQDLTSYETVIFESAQDLYCLTSLLGRYGNYEHTRYVLLADLLNETYSNFRSGGGDWVLWLDGFSSRSSELNQIAHWEELGKKLKNKPQTWLPPEGSHRPPVWSFGWLPYYDKIEAVAWAGMARDQMEDFKGEILFSSLCDYQFATQLKVKNKFTYIFELLSRSLD